jgi:very-short-patch-repair endonuclease
MDAKSSIRSVDSLIARLARQQHGAVSRRQLLATGLTREQIARRCRSGRLTQLHQGVYLVGVVPGQHTHAMAALLACERGAVLSHRSAAALWNLLPYPATAPVWITIPPERQIDRPRIKTVRADLEPSDLRRRLGIPLTSPPRTILDLATQLPIDELEQLVAEANYRRLARDQELREQVERNDRRRGVARLRQVLDLPGGPKRTRSPAERALLSLLRRAGIEGFETNALVLGYEVDFLWRELDFAVEVDGWDAHSGRVAFERDRLKVARLGAGGVQVMPVTGRQIRRDPDGVLARLVGALATARQAGTGLDK